MELDEIKTMVDIVLDVKLKELKETPEDDVDPVFQVHAKDGAIHLFPLLPGIIESARNKEIFGDLIRKMVRLTDADAVVYVMCAWIGQPTPQAMKVINERNLSVSKAAELGLVTKRECLVATYETPTVAGSRIQFYTRDEKAKQITFEERGNFDDMNFGLGNLSGFFPVSEANDKRMDADIDARTDAELNPRQ